MKFISGQTWNRRGALAVAAGCLWASHLQAFQSPRVLPPEREGLLSEIPLLPLGRTEITRWKLVRINADGSVSTREAIGLNRREGGLQRRQLLRIAGPGSSAGSAFLAIPTDSELPRMHYRDAGSRYVRELLPIHLPERFADSLWSFEELLCLPSAYHVTESIEQRVDGVRCGHLMTVAAQPDLKAHSAFSRREVWAARDDYRPIQIDAYGREGTKQRTSRWTYDYTVVEGRVYQGLQRVELIDRSTGDLEVAICLQRVVRDDVPLAWFTPEALADWSAAEAARLQAMLDG
ncbi:MAG: outer membrane lipoprotein-sorting protein [Opitutales bacterium]